MNITTKYSGPGKFYFNKIIDNIIKIGDLENTDKIILDYGCGEKILSKKLKNKSVLNYDINSLYSDYESIENLKFDIVIMNHILMYLNTKEIIDTFNKIKLLNPSCKFIIGIAKHNLLSKISKTLAFSFDAHKHTK